MKRTKSLGFTSLLVVLLLTVPLVVCKSAPSNEEKDHPDFDVQAHVKGGKWSQPLMPIFESAARKHDVPLPLLLTLAYFGSAFENRGDAPTIEGGYGVMALRDNKTGGKSLEEGAGITKVPKEQLKTNPHANINAAAAVLSAYAHQMKIDRSKGLEAWLEPVIKYAGLEEEFARLFAREVYEKLMTGLDWTNSSGERFFFPPQDIGAIDLSDLEPKYTVPEVQSSEITPLEMEANIIRVLSADYPPAIWYPAASCNYSAYYTAKDTIVCHTIEGSAAGCLSWFRNCNAQVSAHYVVSESGTVWQCVDEDYKAWHVGCYNSRSIGIEHEGYASSPSHPQALYDASGLLARDICDSWGIPKEKRTVGPGILGHIDVTRCCCGTHTDPGNGWDWNYYIQVVQGAPPPPTWAATFHAESYPSSMVAGSTAIVWAEFVNQGTGVWTHSNTRLGTSSPQDRTSPFCNPSNWVSCNRPTDVDQSSVSNGQVGRFTFILKAPSTPGTYVEKYRLVQEGVTWFGPEISWTITVTPATGNVTGTVRNAANGQAIAGATVEIVGVSSTSTNSSGVYTFNNVTAGTYTITASKVGFNASSSPVTVNAGETTTKDFNLVPLDTSPPSAPAGLVATAISPSQINLAWTASTDNVGVAGYKVYRNSTQIGSTTGTTFQDNGLAANTTYTYYVTAYDAANNVSPASNLAIATTYPAEVPIFEDGFANLDYWENIVQSPMPGPYPPILTSEQNHATFPGIYSLRTRTSSDPNQGCLIGHRFVPAYGAARFETYFFDGTGMDYATGFEGTIDGWVSYPQAYATLSSVGGGQSGNCLQASDGGWTSGCYKEINSGFTAGENYTLSMWVKWPPPNAGKSYTTPPRCFVRFFDSGGAEIRTDYSADITTDNTWRHYTVSGSIPSGTAKIWIGHWGVRGETYTYTYFADTVTFTTRSANPVNNNSRQGLQVRCITPEGGVKAIYYIGTYSVGGPTDAPKYYSVGYYKVCGEGCTGWYWTYLVRQRTSGWHKFTLDFLPYTGSGDVKAYIDGDLVATLDRTLDTHLYGLGMVAYGFHYRVNVESWFDDVAMYATQPHPAPTMGIPEALSPNSIRWRFTDNSNNEIGFKVIDQANVTKTTTGPLQGVGSAGYADEGGLTPNTPYTRIIRAFNGSLDSFNSSPATKWTLSAPPTEATVICNKPTNVWQQSPEFIFSAVGGFGEGTVAGYEIAWDQNPSYTFSGTETRWSSGDLVLNATSDGAWYLHVRGYNGEGVYNGTLDLGPYKYDGTPPLNATSATEVNGVQNNVWQSTVNDPAFTWSGASDEVSGLAGYLVYFGPGETETSDHMVTSAYYDPPAVDTGTYYLRVCAKDNAGNQAQEWSTLFTFRYDGTPPGVPIVEDDGPYSGSRTKIHATWHATDSESGIAEYQYAVGTAPGQADVVSWTSAGLADESVITIPEPGMSTGTTYYVSVKARNEAGLWSAVGSSDGIQLAPEFATIAAAKALPNTVPVALARKVVTASFANSYYIEEIDRSSGILVLGPGPNPGAVVTVGGQLGANAMGERAIVNPVTITDEEPNLERIPDPLFILLRELGGGDFNSETFGVTNHLALNNVGLLVAVAGRVQTVAQYEFTLDDGSGPVRAVASGFDIPGLINTGDVVLLRGISSLEEEEGIRKPLIRLRGPEDIEKKN